MSNADIPPFLTYVRSEYLYSLKEGFGYFTPATVFAISSRPNETLKFQILADDKTHFGDIPVCALANSKSAPKISEEECVFAPCPEEKFIVNQYEFLASIGICGVWKRDGSFWQSGTYMFSVEWENKFVLHLVELEDGNYILWPSDKLTWNDSDELPTYQ